MKEKTATLRVRVSLAMLAAIEDRLLVTAETPSVYVRRLLAADLGERFPVVVRGWAGRENPRQGAQGRAESPPGERQGRRQMTLDQLAEETVDRCDSINTMDSDQRRESKAIIRTAIARAASEAVIELRKLLAAKAKEPDPPVRWQDDDSPQSETTFGVCRTPAPPRSRTLQEVEKLSAWESECLALATKIVQKHGGKGEGGHIIDRLIFLDAKLTELEER